MRPLPSLYLPWRSAYQAAEYPRFQTVHHIDGRVFEITRHSEQKAVYRIDREIVTREVFYEELYGPKDDIT